MLTLCVGCVGGVGWGEFELEWAEERGGRGQGAGGAQVYKGPRAGLEHHLSTGKIEKSRGWQFPRRLRGKAGLR